VDGLANPSNGELPRVASATPKPYLARLFISHDFGFGDAVEHVESDENQLAGDRPMTRYTITAGDSPQRFLRRQQLFARSAHPVHGVGLMYNGAWDYPADTRGYTWGIVNEFHTRNWSFAIWGGRRASVANGSAV
jgi:high affinity Mn2+ porin